MDKEARYLSMVLTALTWGWDAYAQAHGIPYKVDDWLKGIILAPYVKLAAEKAWQGGKSAILKVRASKQGNGERDKHP